MHELPPPSKKPSAWSRLPAWARWLIVLALAACTTAPGLLGNLTRGLWITVNVVWLGYAFWWGVFHPRCVWTKLEPVLRVSFWLTLLVALCLTNVVEAAIARQSALQGYLAGGGQLLATFIAPILFGLLCGAGWLGAALGGATARRAPDEDRLAAVGAPFFAVVSVLIPLTLTLAGRANDEKNGITAFASLPLLTSAYVLFRRNPAADPERLSRFVELRLLGRLVWRRERNGSISILDARGVTLGLVAGATVLAANTAGAFTPRQHGTLVSLMRLRNSAAALFELRATSPRLPRRVVRLQWDAPARRAAVTTGSEAAVQAELIQKLTAWKPLRIVLPLPALTLQSIPEIHTEPWPRPDGDAVDRTKRDMPRLVQAVRDAGNVVLTARSRTVQSLRQAPKPGEAPPGRPLLQAAREAGASDLRLLGTAGLVALPVQPDPLPLPAVLHAALRERPAEVAPLGRGSEQIRINGETVPAIGPNEVLIDLPTPESGRDLIRLTYGSVLRGEPVYGRPVVPPGEPDPLPSWLSPRDYFRGRVVVLEPLVDSSLPGPAGRVTQSDALAHGTITLLDGRMERRLPTWLFVLFVFLVSIFVGARVYGREPLAGIGIVTLSVLIIALLSVVVQFGRMWLDPVVPSLGALVAYLFSTQLTFRKNRQNARAALERMVGPQFDIEKLLDDPEAVMEGRRRPVVVLFADVRNFSSFAERYSPERVVEVINDYMGAITDPLLEAGGFLDKYTGDGLMGFFLVDEANPRETVTRSVRAALAMQRSAQRVSASLAEAGGESLQIGIGLHYGEAIMGLVGGKSRRTEYTALGHTVVVSARLQTIAGGGEVIVSNEVFSATSGSFLTEPREPVRVKGLSAPVQPYLIQAEVVG